MTYTKKLVLVAVAALAITALAGAGQAAATVLCKSSPENHVCPPADKYGVGTEITSQLKNGTKFVFLAGYANIECSNSTLNARLTNAGAKNTPVSAEVTAYSFGACGAGTFTVEERGGLDINWLEGTNDGKFTTHGLKVKVQVGATTCTYGGELKSGITVGGGSSPNIVFHEAPVPRLAGGILCANPAKWSAEYSITSPKPVFVAAE